MRNELSNGLFTLRRSQVAIEMFGYLQSLEPISPVVATVPPIICRKEVIVKAPTVTSAPIVNIAPSAYTQRLTHSL